MEKLKLVTENGETILMTKSEYMELAKQKGWNTKIPRLEDGTYDCDVFGGDGVELDSFYSLSFSGILCLKDNAHLHCDISADCGIILGDNVDTYDLFSDNGDIILGDNADTCELTAKNVICGDGLYTNYSSVYATDGFVILSKGFNSDYEDNDDVEISATEDIICDDELET